MTSTTVTRIDRMNGVDLIGGTVANAHGTEFHVRGSSSTPAQAPSSSSSRPSTRTASGSRAPTLASTHWAAGPSTDATWPQSPGSIIGPGALPHRGPA